VVSGAVAAPPRRRSSTTKHDITVEAAALFGERGFAAVSMQEIADRVGITAAAIYRHYPSKDAVLDAVLFESISTCELVTPPSVDADDPAATSMRMSVQLVVDYPDQLATYARERHRATPDADRELARREAELFDRWSQGILAARPELAASDLILRQLAVNGVLSALTQRSSELARGRLLTLVTDGLVSLVTAHPVVDPSRTTDTVTEWRAPESRREQILRVAMRLFAECGYHGVGMNDIGEATGMSGPSLYEHVPGKADILIDAYERAASFAIVGACDALASASSPSDALDRLLHSHIEVAFDHVDLLVVASRESNALPDSEQPRIERRRHDLLEKWVSVIRELRDDVSIADAIVLVHATFALISTMARHRRRGSPSVDATARLAHAFLMGDSSQSEEKKSDDE
jgi:AcrR family transcriptional regulator